MRVTKQEVADATGLQDVEELTELSLANKYVHEVGFIAKMRGLSDLNLAFNELESIDDLRRNTELRRLNVAHNKLRTLAGIESMAQLRSLRASNNKLRGVQTIAACRSLEECWLQQNKLADLAAVVNALRALPNLRNLVLMGNPCCERAEYRAWVISQLPSLELLDGQGVGDERVQLGDGPAPQLGQLVATDRDDDSSDEDGDVEDDGDGGPQLRRGEWTVTDARGQKVHMGRKPKRTNKAKTTASGARRSGASGAANYDYGLQQGGEALSPSPRDELRQALAGLRKWTEAALPVVERFVAAIAATVAASSAAPLGAESSARARSRSRRTPRGGAVLASHRQAANAATETCRRLQRAATHAATEAAPSVRFAEEVLKQLAKKSSAGGQSDKGNTGKSENGGGPSSIESQGSPGRRRRKRSNVRAASVQRHVDDASAGASFSARCSSNITGRVAGNGSRSRSRATGSTPRSPQGTGRRTKSTSRTGSNSRGSNSRGSSGSASRLSGGSGNGGGHIKRTGSNSRRSLSTTRRARPPQSPSQPQKQPQARSVSRTTPPTTGGPALHPSISDSDSGSDSDLETIGLAAAAREANTRKLSKSAAASPSSVARMNSSPSRAGQHIQSTAAPTRMKAAGEARPADPGPLSSQYVPAIVELLAAELERGTDGSTAGAYSWHAAAAEFGAAESSLGRTDHLVSGAAADNGLTLGGIPQGVRAVASDPPYADGPLHNTNIVRGSIAIVQRGHCTFLDKARRVQEAGGVGVIFVNSAETLFVPHGTPEDPGGDIRIPAVCLRKKDGDMLLAIASLGHEGTANITMTF